MKIILKKLVISGLRKVDAYTMKPIRVLIEKNSSLKKARKSALEEEEFLRTVSNMCGGFTGRSILEVGADQKGRMLRSIVNTHQAKEAVGVNIAVNDEQFQRNCRVVKGDITQSEFRDAEFDILFSTAVFEHVHHFDKAILEMYRILKPGGLLFSNHGPLWSTSYGHHLWTRYGGQEYTYWNVILPPHCHLLMSPQEVHEYLTGQSINPEACRKLVKYIFESEDQNRLMYDDYERIIKASNFEILIMKGYDHPEIANRYITKEFIANLDLLRNKFPGYHNFHSDGMMVLLRKPL